MISDPPVQSKSGNSGASYQQVGTLQWDNDNIAGNTLFLFIGSSSSTTDNVSSVTDTAGNTWVRQKRITLSPTNGGLDLWMCENCVAGTAPTVTINTTDFTTRSYVMYEFSGLMVPAFDVEVTHIQTGSYTQSHASGNTASTSQARTLVFAAMEYSNNGETLTVSSGYSTVINESNATQFSGIGVAYKVVTSAGAQSATFTSVGFNEHLIYVGAFKEATATTTSPQSTLLLLNVG